MDCGCGGEVQSRKTNNGPVVDLSPAINALANGATTLVASPFIKRRGGLLVVGVVSTAFHFGNDTGSRLKLLWT